MSSSIPTLTNMQVFEVFPQERLTPQYFAEFGDKLPQKLKSGINLFMLEQTGDAEPEPEPTEPAKKLFKCGTEAPSDATDESVKKHKKKRKVEEEEQPVVEEPVIAKKSVKKSSEPRFKLYMKALQDGVLGKKGELIEAQKIPSGTFVHLVKRKKYVKTMIFYENSWVNFG
jgi:hypothetical protein